MMGKWVCVAMDWGATHTVGYLDELGFKNSEKRIILKLKIKQIRKLRGLK